jgi:hypothetical protein
MASNQETEDTSQVQAEPSKLGKKLEFSSQEDVWSEYNAKRFDALAYAYRTDQEGMSKEDVLEFCRLSAKKNEILKAQDFKRMQRMAKKEEAKSAKKETKSKTFKSAFKWADDVDEEEKRESRKKSSKTGDEESESSSSEDSEASPENSSSSEEDEPVRPRKGSSKKKTKHREEQSSSSDESDPGTMKDLERRLSKMINEKFYSLVDADKTQSREGELEPPKLGKNKSLPDKLERELKSSCKNLQFGDKATPGKPLLYVLEVHRSFSNRAKLTNKASINLLLRFLSGQPFSMVNSLRTAGAKISLIYSHLQSAFRDVPDPVQATKLMEAFISNPNLIQLTKVSSKVLEIASLIHQNESKKSRALNTQVTATSYLQQYLQRYYSRVEVTRINTFFLKWKMRNQGIKNPLEIYFQLTSIATAQLSGQLPSYARQVGAQRQEHSQPNAQYRPPHQVQQVFEDLDDFPLDSASQVSQQDFDDYQAGLQDSDTASVLQAVEQQAPKPKYRCLLCNMDSHPGNQPAFFRSCPFYKGCVPGKTIQPCCRGRHPSVLKCLSPLAKKDNVDDKPKVKVYS